MGIISRGFSGRRSAADVKLPPGQYLTTDFPSFVRRTDATHIARPVGICDRRRHDGSAEMGLEVVSRLAHRDLHGGSALRHAMVENSAHPGRAFHSTPYLQT
jgi:hypothetical protein